MEAWTPLDAYRTLSARFGPQGWWPVTPSGGTRPLYHVHRRPAPGLGRLSPRHALEVSVGALLTQNTAWSNVEKAIVRLHRARALHDGELLRMPLSRLERLIRPSGYFRQKARRLRTFLRSAELRGGLTRWLARGSLSALREDLLGVSGVGPETADSILLYAGGHPAFVVDAYTIRIGGRLGWFDHGRKPSYHEVQEFLVRRLPKSVDVYREFHALFVALAKFYCRTKPLCSACPLFERCDYGAAHAR